MNSELFFCMAELLYALVKNSILTARGSSAYLYKELIPLLRQSFEIGIIA